MLPAPLAPGPNDIPYNDVVSAQVGPGEKLTATFTADQRVTTFHLPMLLASKYPESSYEVKLDRRTVFGPAPIPPSDIDDTAVTFLPPKEFGQEMTVIVKNLSSNKTRTYAVQPVGWEEVNDGA